MLVAYNLFGNQLGLKAFLSYTAAASIEENKFNLKSTNYFQSLRTPMKIDLHSHTYYSDGQLSPEELVLRAHTMQVDALAITDHDTTNAIPEALHAQSLQSRKLLIIPGIEFSTAWHGFDIHILGLNLNLSSPGLQQGIAAQTQARAERAEAINNKLEKAGCTGVLAQAQVFARKGQVTRAHFARALQHLGYVESADAAFKKYLGKDKRAHVKPKWASMGQAIEWIHAGGGKAVVAHPGHYKLSAKWLRRLLVEFKAEGGDGMEVCHPRISPDMKRQLAIYAREYDLQASAGSDFHFPNRWTELGRHLTIPEDLCPVWHDWNLF